MKKETPQNFPFKSGLCMYLFQEMNYFSLSIQSFTYIRNINELELGAIRF